MPPSPSNSTSTSTSTIAKAQITIADETKQKELTGKTAAASIASLSRDTDGAQQKLANDFKADKINELFSATKLFLQEGSTFMANRTAEADAAKKALDGTSASLKAEQAKPQELQNQALIRQLDAQIASQTAQKTEADKWMPGGSYGRAMTALQAAVGGNVTGGVNGLLQNASVAYLQSMGAEEIKAIANSFQTKKGEENQTSQNVRTALHAIASCAGATASGSNCSSAAVGAASSVVINNVLSEIENTTADKMTASDKEKRKNLVGSIITGIVAVADGNAAAANNAAQIEMENNMLVSSQQFDRIKKLAKGDKNKEARLLAAACIQRKCSAGLPKDDPNYADFVELEKWGSRNDLTAENKLLKNQAQAVYVGYHGETLQLPMFVDYSPPMAALDLANRHQVGTRVAGAVQAVGGVAEIVGAGGFATTCETGVGCFIAGALATAGVDNMNTGVRTSIKGKQVNTLGAQIIQQVFGSSLEKSELIYGVLQIGATPAVVSKLETVLDINNVSKAWESAKILNTGEVTTSVKGFISSQKITTQGMPAALNPAELSQLSKLNQLDIATAGALRETVADSYFTRNGFKSLDGKCGVNCFDGVYMKGDKVIINEVKPLNTNNSITLSSNSKSINNIGPQMSDQWVTSRVNELVASGDPIKMATATAILKAEKNGTLVKMVSGVSDSKMTMVRLK